MPAEGLDWLPGPAPLTDAEMARLITLAVQRLGITEVRFTDGEPLLRRGLAGLVAAAAALRPRPEISLTTNGIGLARLAGPLRDAGLDRINVSLDTLSPETFVTLARRDRLADVLGGLSAAAAAGLGTPGCEAPSAADMRVRYRGELADERRGEKDEPERDLVEAAQLAAAGGEHEHEHRRDGQNEGEGVHAAPGVSPRGLGGSE